MIVFQYLLRYGDEVLSDIGSELGVVWGGGFCGDFVGGGFEEGDGVGEIYCCRTTFEKVIKFGSDVLEEFPTRLRICDSLLIFFLFLQVLSLKYHLSYVPTQQPKQEQRR